MAGEQTWTTSLNWRFTATQEPALTALNPATTDGSLANPAGLTFFNNVGSGAVLKLRKITYRDRTFQEMSTYPVFTHNILWVTLSNDAPTTGTDVIVPVKHDTDAPTLNGFVNAIRLSNYVSLPAMTQANPESVRKLLIIPTLGIAGNGGVYDRSLGKFNAKVFDVPTRNGLTQKTTLREGEATTFFMGTAWSCPKSWRVTIQVIVGGFTYSYCAPVIWGSDLTSPAVVQGLCIRNATGSGVVVDIVDIDIHENTQDNDGTAVPDNWTHPKFTLETVQKIIDGTDLVCTPMDTNNTAMPSGLLVRAAGFVVQVQPDSLIGTDHIGDWPLRNVVHPTYGTTSATFGGTAGIRPTYGLYGGAMAGLGHTIWEGEYVVREGRGMTLRQMETLSGVGNWEIDAQFNVEYTPPAAAGGYSRGRVVNV